MNNTQDIPRNKKLSPEKDNTFLTGAREALTDDEQQLPTYPIPVMNNQQYQHESQQILKSESKHSKRSSLYEKQP